MGTINYFKIAGQVIEANIASIVKRNGISRKNAVQEIDKYLKENSKQWLSGKQPAIRYEDPLCRIAYLYKIVPVNANLVELVFRSEPELVAHLDTMQSKSGQVGVCAFGGGPGTELLGLAKWIEARKRKQQVVLDFLLLDQVNEWADSWQAIRRSINGGFKASFPDQQKWPLTFTGTFTKVDITNTKNFANLGSLFDQDIYILSYVLSEIFDNVQDLHEFTVTMAEQAPAGSKFVFIDRRGPRWKSQVKKLATEAGIDLAPFRENKGSMDLSEQKVDLGNIHTEVAESPRTTWDVFWVVGTKR